MQVTALLVAAVLAAEPAALRPGCRNGLLGPEGPEAFVGLESYPTAKLLRPLTLPRWTWSVSGAGVYSGNYTSTFAAHGGGLVLGAASSPVCNVEVSVLTAHQLAPSPHPLSAVVPQVVVALTPSVGLAATTQIQVQPSGAGLQAAVAYLGAPIRFRLTDWLGLIGLEQLLGVEVYWGAPIATIVLPTAALPLGLLLQPSPFVSIEVRVRPRVGLSPLAFWRVDFEAEILVAPRRWIDFLVTGYGSAASSSQLVVSLGTRLRL